MEMTHINNENLFITDRTQQTWDRNESRCKRSKQRLIALLCLGFDNTMRGIIVAESAWNYKSRLGSTWIFIFSSDRSCVCGLCITETADLEMNTSHKLFRLEKKSWIYLWWCFFMVAAAPFDQPQDDLHCYLPLRISHKESLTLCFFFFFFYSWGVF